MNEEDSQRIAEKIVALAEPILFEKIGKALNSSS